MALPTNLPPDITIHRPPTFSEAVVPSDSTDVPGLFYKYIYVGLTGDLKVTTLEGNVVTFKSVPTGSRIDGVVTRVWATGTTATLMIGQR